MTTIPVSGHPTLLQVVTVTNSETALPWVSHKSASLLLPNSVACGVELAKEALGSDLVLVHGRHERSEDRFDSAKTQEVGEVY